MIKKIIIKNILKITPVIIGTILFMINKSSPVGISLLFIEGYIILKNTLDYRQLNKNIKEIKYLKNYLSSSRENKDKEYSEIYRKEYSSELANNLDKEKTNYNSMKESSNSYLYTNQSINYQTNITKLATGKLFKVRKRTKNNKKD